MNLKSSWNYFSVVVRGAIQKKLHSLLFKSLSFEQKLIHLPSVYWLTDSFVQNCRANNMKHKISWKTTFLLGQGLQNRIVTCLPLVITFPLSLGQYYVLAKTSIHSEIRQLYFYCRKWQKKKRGVRIFEKFVWWPFNSFLSLPTCPGLHEKMQPSFQSDRKQKNSIHKTKMYLH